jgi:hypothetical protein
MFDAAYPIRIHMRLLCNLDNVAAIKNSMYGSKPPVLSAAQPTQTTGCCTLPADWVHQSQYGPYKQIRPGD